MADFALDPYLLAMDDCSLVSIKATIVLRKPGVTVCQSVLQKQSFCTSVNLDFVQGEFSILDGIVRKIQGRVWVEAGPTTEVINRPPPNVAEPLSAVEMCAGLGIGSTAFHACGIKTQCYNDQNPKYCQWLEQTVSQEAKVICGDLTTAATLKAVSDAAPFAQFLSAGISCQPFSFLGDQRQQYDDRSRSLPGVLKSAYHLNVTWLLLECTKEARFSNWAQGMIDTFCRETGFRAEQQILDLHKTWPAHRTRWFAVLTHPSMPAVPIPNMPMLPWIPSLLHLTPGVLPMTHECMDDMKLDFHELKAFNENRKGIHGSIINMCKPMQTATHSWGSQLRKCECGCREQGFSNARLRDKGLYGQLVPLGEEFHHDCYSFHAMRHLHPHEVALYNGMDPKYIVLSDIGSARFELSGVGQMASPLQIAWIVANVLFETHNLDRISTTCNPLLVMHNMFGQLFASRDELWRVTDKTVYMEIFESAVFKLVDNTVIGEHVSLTQQMFDQAVRFENQLVRTARTAHVTQNIMPAATPLPHVRRDEQVLPPVSLSRRRHSAQDSQPASIPDPWQRALDRGDVTRPPMSDTPFHADPVGADFSTGPSHVELSDVTGTLTTDTSASSELPQVLSVSIAAVPGQDVPQDVRSDALLTEVDAPNFHALTALDSTQVSVISLDLAGEPKPEAMPHLPMTSEFVHAHPEGGHSTPGPSQDLWGGGKYETMSVPNETDRDCAPVDRYVLPVEAVAPMIFAAPDHDSTKETEASLNVDDELKHEAMPHLPMFPDHVHANPGSGHSTPGPTQHIEKGGEYDLEQPQPHLPMSDVLFHADPTSGDHAKVGPSLASASHAASSDEPASDVSSVIPMETHVSSEHVQLTDIPKPLYSAQGGLTFASKRVAPVDEAPQPSAKVPKIGLSVDHALESTAPWSQPIDFDRYITQDFCYPGAGSDPIVIQVGIDFGPLQPRKVERVTIQAFLEAEEKLHGRPFTCTDILGRPITEGLLVHNYIFLLFSDDADFCQLVSPEAVKPADRLTQLWYQQGMVALDEMKFYLQQVRSDCAISSSPVLFQCTASIDEQLDDMIGKAVEICAVTSQPYAISHMCLFQGHWFPIHIWIDQPVAHIYTTPEGLALIHPWSPSFTHDGFVWHSVSIESQHDLDCGFQSLQWIQHLRYYWDRVEPMWGREMLALKHEFAVAVQDGHIVPCSPNPLGGASEAALRQSLKDLLEQHGVSTDRSVQCASSLVDKLGHQKVANILGAKNAWRDLKASASQLRPPFQIVLASELQVSIDARAAKQQSFGKKSTKQTKTSQANKHIRIKPDQIALPDGIFHAEGQSLSHISVTGIASNRTGVALVSIDEAIPFFSLHEPISTGGLAMIILDHQDARIPACAEIIKFPAQFTLTDEPVLLTGAMLQLGKSGVKRTLPDRPTSVDEIDTRAIRVLIYRDQWHDDWDVLSRGPVKAIKAHKAFERIEDNQIIDVWDRQFLDQQFRRTSGAQAFLFAVNLRLPVELALDLMDKSSTEGVYVEPRSENGRYPCSTYAIVWMPKKSLADVVLASQTATIKCWVVRNGLRYGLRVAASEAAALHQAYRPDIDYIAGSDKQTYRLGPFPWGTTKQGLQKLFKEWGWQARVGQPAGQDVDNKGVFWTAVATESPSHWVFTMAHGDILISVQQQKEALVKPSHGVVASHRTLKQIAAVDAGPLDTKHDPWLHQDPWSKSSKPAPTPTLGKDQLDLLEKNVTQKVREALGPADDVTMTGEQDSRVSQLEEQVKSLTTNFNQFHGHVTAFQAQQQQHNTQVGSQISAIKTQVETQASSLQGMIETKLDDQMSRLEALLSKRLKTHE